MWRDLALYCNRDDEWCIWLEHSVHDFDLDADCWKVCARTGNALWLAAP